MRKSSAILIAPPSGGLQLPPWYKSPPLSSVVAPLPATEKAWRDALNLAIQAHQILPTLTSEKLLGSWWGKTYSLPQGTNYDVAISVDKDNAINLPGLLHLKDEIKQKYPIDRVLIVVKSPPISSHPAATKPLPDWITDWERAGATLVRETIDPWSLFPAIPCLYAFDDEIGLIALLVGTRVICHDDRFYSGWGLTEDRPGVFRHDRALTLPELFALHFLYRSRYSNPYTGDACDFATALEVVRACRHVEQANRQIAVCTGMAFWKRQRIAQFFYNRNGAPLFIDNARKAVEAARARQGGIAVWASREPASLASRAKAAGVTIHRVEDGFIRSAGLGADFIPPASITVDSLGIYYDPSQPSQLERILEEISLTPTDVRRIRDLIALMISRNVTKYSSTGHVSVQAPPDRRRIVVPGQVEDDRSVLLARAGVQGNLDLLQRVRAANPTAYIVYKPHPDVEAGHRPGAIQDEVALRSADRIIRDGSMGELIQSCDELHCLTSLAGFEALLRNKAVTVYGQPFYAGWGLTTDISPPPRRQRRLSIEELVAGTLLIYPRYLDPLTGIPCSPEMLIGRLVQQTTWCPPLLVRARRLQGRLCRFLRSQALRFKLHSVSR